MYIYLSLGIHPAVSIGIQAVFSRMGERFLLEFGVTETAEAEAALAIGRLSGALDHCSAAAQRIFAGMVLRHSLIDALRQEGHAFTDIRFNAWFAGLATLSDSASHAARAPRALCEGILAELAHSSWQPMADLAARLRPALLAHGDMKGEGARSSITTVIEDARNLTAAHAHHPQSLPFDLLSRLHHDVSRSVRFAPPERQQTPWAVKERTYPLDRPPLPSPRWAIELMYGECLRRVGLLPYALPCLGLVRLDALSADTAEEARVIRANALRHLACTLLERLAEATMLARQNALGIAQQRSTSRTGPLFELLAGFGPMRSAQMEVYLAASRIGVRGMIAKLSETGMLDRVVVAGSHLFSVKASTGCHPIDMTKATEPAFSRMALDDFEASLAHLDGLLGNDAELNNDTRAP